MTATPIMSERRVSFIGAFLVAIGPISMALYTPAMTELVAAFGSTESVIKLTLTLYFGGFACAQLIAGPLSDALGRRPVTIAFLSLYCAASVLAMLAPSVEVLILARFAQGVGASVGVAISRALVRDLYTDERSSRIMNLIGIILALGPALAPTLGGLMLLAFGWRSLFVLMTLIGIGTIGVILIYMKETVQRDLSRLNLVQLGRSYRVVLGNRQFLTSAAVIGGALGAIYAQATFLPFILIDAVGLTPQQFGLSMLAQSGSFFTASVVMRLLMSRYEAKRLVPVGLCLIAIGSLGTMTLLFSPPSFLHVMIPVAIYAFGIAFVMPDMSTVALAPFRREAGAAAALLGFIQMGSGLVVGTLGAFIGDAVLAMAMLIPIMGFWACIAYYLYRRTDVIVPPSSGATPPGAGPLTPRTAPVTGPNR